MATKTMMALEGHDNQEKGNPFDTEDEELDKTNPFSIDGEPSSPFSESESEITAGSNPDNNSETTNPFEGGSDDNSNHLQCGSTMTAPTIEIRKASLPGNNSFSSNPFENSVDTEDKYGDCYKDLDNTVGQPDEDETEAMDFYREAESTKMENKDDKFGKDFTVTQLRKRQSTIRRIGSLKQTPSKKAFRCPKEFCGFFASSADKLAIHVDRFHGTYHDLLSPASPKLSQSRRKNSPVLPGVKGMSEIIWGTMSAGNIHYEEVVQYVPVGWVDASANSIPAQMLSCTVGQGYIIPLKTQQKLLFLAL